MPDDWQALRQMKVSGTACLTYGWSAFRQGCRRKAWLSDGRLHQPELGSQKRSQQADLVSASVERLIAHRGADPQRPVAEVQCPGRRGVQPCREPHAPRIPKRQLPIRANWLSAQVVRDRYQGHGIALAADNSTRQSRNRSHWQCTSSRSAVASRLRRRRFDSGRIRGFREAPAARGTRRAIREARAPLRVVVRRPVCGDQGESLRTEAAPEAVPRTSPIPPSSHLIVVPKCLRWGCAGQWPPVAPERRQGSPKDLGIPERGPRPAFRLYPGPSQAP